jgi:pimeloyl-ACP methyl ester carboxylesterase
VSKVRVNGVELYYELHGFEHSELLVLNNGVLMNAATSWAFQTKPLSRHYRVLQYDCRGQGQSGHPDGPYSMEQHADDLAALLSALGIDSAHIAGISYGGEVAQAFALKYPDRTRSLVLADTVSEVGPELRITIQSWITAARSGDAPAFFDATVAWNFAPEFIAANPALLEDAKRRYALLDFPAVIRLCECFLMVDFTARLPEIEAPTCILYGEKDLLKGRAYAESLSRNIPHAEVHVLRGAGHATCWERAEEFNTIVLGFLAKHKRADV